ncbi:MAG: hypothetical protein RLZZ293_654 [Pseudomonadota bacterium]|jgi:zinc/manganese transport system permease protein
MWAYDFMRNALMSGLIIASICAIVSVFIILRRSAFAAHALGHMSITGAAGAGLCGISAFSGQLYLNILAAIVIGIMSDKVKKNDLAVGVVLTFVLGLGVYFLFLFQNNYAGGVMSILFGNIFAVSHQQLKQLIGLASIILVTLGIVLRPLWFSSLDPIVARSKNIPLRSLSIIFLLIIAITVSMACQIVGALLVFVLLIIPGAIALQWGQSLGTIMLISFFSANCAVIGALVIAYYANLPASFCITMLLCGGYFIGVVKNYLQSI